VCNGTNAPYGVADWLLTTRPGVFGLLGGWANPTGVALVLLLTLMTACSLPCVRKGGYFQVFYYSHLSYWPFAVLLVLHAPAAWLWLIAPLIVLAAERAHRAAATFAGQGRTVVLDAVTMPSRLGK